MRILSHYFVARYLGLLATVLVATFLLLATVELVLNFDDLASLSNISTVSTNSAVSTPSAASTPIESANGPGAGPAELGALGLARAIAIRLAAYYFPDVLPLASFLSVFITFAWAGRSLELIGVQAGGVRLARVVIPVLCTTLILSLAAALLHETLVLRARQTWSSQIEGRQGQPDFGREAFWVHKGRTITNIAYADAATRSLHGVEIFERSATGTIGRVIRAERVDIASDGVWHLQEASIWNFDPSDPSGDPRLERQTSMSLDLDAIGGDALLQADPALLSLVDLTDYLRGQPGTTPARLRQLESLRAERFASPWLVALFGWLALPFALRVDRRGRIGLPAAMSLVAVSAFFVFRTAGTTLAQQELFPVGVTPWLVMSVAFVASAAAMHRRL